MIAGTANEDNDFGFQIAPMVDVVFVLLLFFMACAGQSLPEKFLKVGPPASGIPCDLPIIIDIDASGNIFLNSSPKSTSPTDKELPQLRAALEAGMETSPEDPVILRPAPATRHERLIDVLNTCRQAKVKNLSFQ